MIPPSSRPPTIWAAASLALVPVKSAKSISTMKTKELLACFKSYGSPLRELDDVWDGDLTCIISRK